MLLTVGCIMSLNANGVSNYDPLFHSGILLHTKIIMDSNVKMFSYNELQLRMRNFLLLSVRTL